LIILNKNILIVGAAGRIGGATAKKLFSSGANLVLSDFNLKNLVSISNNFQSKFSNQFNLIKTDITNEKEITELIKKAESIMGTIDGALFATYPRSKQWGNSIENLKLKYINEDLANQLGSAIYFSKEILESFKKNKKGSLVHLSSIYGLRAPKFGIYENTEMISPIEYSAIKSGIISICKWLAKYYSNNNIRVNCVSPGGILDDQPDNFIKKYREQCTNIGMLSAEQIAEAILFLLSEKSSAINGENIVIDDGWSL
tara:strand:- start:732 stop:1502 length:771 start_codon:yes stop_codon:yes gene_type:complete